ncbi:replication-relaxation family protein [Priestia aryabhattai]|uniref:replication-relaxation family protein n=1 Tax=Priestia aryabhattai TaxID=412384 RepID=UPI002109C668|nr:replication-relaxation family protein [Priestia aryabhattai]
MRQLAKTLERQEKILLSLSRFSYLSRSQIQIIHEIPSERTAQRVMQQLSKYVSSFMDGEKIFYLNAEGRKYTGCTKICKKMTTARHYIMRNDLFIAYNCPDDWKNEMRLLYKDVNVIADALFESNGIRHIVEVDHTQKMQTNKAKIEKYRKLLEYGVLKNIRLIWMTTTNYRKKKLLEMMGDIKGQVFTISDFH